MKLSEHAMNFLTFQKLERKQNCESYVYSCPSRDKKCALKGTENKFRSLS
jgi:hypothetical protein